MPSLRRSSSLASPASVDPLYHFPRLSDPFHPPPPLNDLPTLNSTFSPSSSEEELTLAEEREMLRMGNEARERRFSAREARMHGGGVGGRGGEGGGMSSLPSSAESASRLARRSSLASPSPRLDHQQQPQHLPRPHHALATLPLSSLPLSQDEDLRRRRDHALSLLDSLPLSLLDALATELQEIALEQQQREREEEEQRRVREEEEERRKRREREAVVERVRALREEEADGEVDEVRGRQEERGSGEGIGVGRRASFPSYSAVPPLRLHQHHHAQHHHPQHHPHRPATTTRASAPAASTSTSTSTSTSVSLPFHQEGGRRTPPPPYTPYDPLSPSSSFSSASSAAGLARAATTSPGMSVGRRRERTDRRPRPGIVRREAARGMEEWV